MVSESGCFSFIRIPASFRSYSISEDQICGSGCGICKRFFSKNLISLNWYRCSIQEASGWAIGYHFWWVLRSAGKERPLCWIPLHENTTQVVLLCFLFWILAVAMTFFFTSRVQNSFTKPLPDLNYNGKNFLWLSFCLYWSYADSAWNCTVPHWQDFVNGSDLA